MLNCYTLFTLLYFTLLYFTCLATIKVKTRFLYTAAYAITGSARFTISEVAVDDWQEPVVLQGKCGHPLRALTYNWPRGMQLASTPPVQSTTTGLHPVSIHQMAPSARGSRHPITAYYSFLDLERMKG